MSEFFSQGTPSLDIVLTFPSCSGQRCQNCTWQSNRKITRFCLHWLSRKGRHGEGTYGSYAADCKSLFKNAMAKSSWDWRCKYNHPNRHPVGTRPFLYNLAGAAPALRVKKVIENPAKKSQPTTTEASAGTEASPPPSTGPKRYNFTVISLPLGWCLVPSRRLSQRKIKGSKLVKRSENKPRKNFRVMVQTFDLTVGFQVTKEEFFSLTLSNPSFEEACHAGRGNISMPTSLIVTP